MDRFMTLWLELSSLGASSDPGYLLRYGLLMLGGWFLLRRILHKLQQWRDGLPPDLEDPYDTAYLRAGPFGVLHQTFLGLIDRQDLIRRADGRYHLNPQSNLATMTPEESALYAWYLRRRPQRAISFPRPGTPSPSIVLGQLLVSRKRRLRQQGLIPYPWRRTWMRLAKYSACLVILGIGYTHLGVTGTMNGWWRPLFIAELLVATTMFLQMELGFWDYLEGAIDSIDWTP
jgi:uncharacterized protein (TIGR04222 family)